MNALSHRLPRSLVIAATLGCPAALRAQNETPVRTVPASSRGVLPVDACAGQPISDIVIINQPPYTDKLPRRVDFLRRGVRALHATTDPAVIQRYLLVKVGDPCNQISRAESERILRAQPFLSDARISVYDNGNGGVRLEVETRDEFSLIVQPLVRTQAPVFRGLRFGEGNFAGAAKLAAVEWRDGLAYNDVLGVQYADYQFLGSRNELRLNVRQAERGQDIRLEVVRPYYTDLQRFAFIGSFGSVRDFVSLRRPGLEQNAVGVAREFANLGGVMRVGPVGRLKLIGGLLTREFERSDTLPRLITPLGFRPDSGGAVPADFRRQRVTRVNALLGVRRIRFERVQGFDALVGAQDVRVGMQVGLVLGQSIGLFGSRDRDRFVATNIYGGVGNQRSFLGVQGVSEARFDRRDGEWDSHVMSGRLAYYAKPATKQLTLMELEYSSGSDMRVPFQLSLADRDGGLLGHRRSQDPGAHRMIFRTEQRLIVPTRYNVGDLGFALFAEAGRLWRGPTAPYSVTTPVRSAAGLSILAAVPPRSRRLWRVDFAMPVGGDRDRKFEVRFSSEDRTRVFWQEPRDVLMARERTIPNSLFTWP
ncbi:MAG TPA: hypothetical protein VE869_06025 [Gemmatimonas sp.]|nr:hypothetical protein [Gemmatimonas sp.]